MITVGEGRHQCSVRIGSRTLPLVTSPLLIFWAVIAAIWKYTSAQFLTTLWYSSSLDGLKLLKQPSSDISSLTSSPARSAAASVAPSLISSELVPTKSEL